jgi:hypothetical protein
MSKTKELKLTETLIRQIDYTMPKLKYSVNVRKIVKWLENFDDEDVKHAIDFLFFLEYIDHAELTYRINEQLERIICEIPSNNNIVIFPGVEEYPKSAELVNYIIKDTPAFKTIQDRTTILRDVFQIKDKTTPTSFILVDDFIGTGDSFCKGYEGAMLKMYFDENSFVAECYALAAICLSIGKLNINRNYPEIKIFAEFRNDIFHKTTSPFQLKQAIDKMKALSEKYGARMKSKPLGYSDSASLISFGHTTPNNTLPIIWHDNNWSPIYPRDAKIKISQAKEIKREVAFYIGIMNRLGIDLYSDESILLKGGRVLKYNHRIDHSLVTVLKLQKENFEGPTICQILGITITEYNIIIEYGKSLDLINHDNKINSNGHDFILKLFTKGKGRKFFAREKGEFELKYVNYVPKTFRGSA